VKSAEEKRKDPCYGELRCWNWVQAICPVYEECKMIAKAKYGVARKVDRVLGRQGFRERRRIG
jgi:hypothetical protein